MDNRVQRIKPVRYQMRWMDEIGLKNSECWLGTDDDDGATAAYEADMQENANSRGSFFLVWRGNQREYLEMRYGKVFVWSGRQAGRRNCCIEDHSHSELFPRNRRQHNRIVSPFVSVLLWSFGVTAYAYQMVLRKSYAEGFRLKHTPAFVTLSSFITLDVLHLRRSETCTFLQFAVIWLADHLLLMISI